MLMWYSSIQRERRVLCCSLKLYSSIKPKPLLFLSIFFSAVATTLLLLLFSVLCCVSLQFSIATTTNQASSFLYVGISTAWLNKAHKCMFICKTFDNLQKERERESFYYCGSVARRRKRKKILRQQDRHRTDISLGVK